MKMLWRIALYLVAPSALAMAQGVPATAADEAAGKAWFSHIQALANDGMRGRLTGTDDYLRAAAYVVEQFKADGLQPAGVDGFYQPVKFDVTRVIAEKSSMALVVDGKRTPLVLGQDGILSARGQQPAAVEAPLVFIGYGLHLPEAHYDDFDSAEVPWGSLKGKIVVVVNGGPAELSGALKSYARTAPLSKALADAGVVGVITVPTPKSMDFGWDRVASSASQPGVADGWAGFPVPPDIADLSEEQVGEMMGSLLEQFGQIGAPYAYSLQQSIPLAATVAQHE